MGAVSAGCHSAFVELVCFTQMIQQNVTLRNTFVAYAH
jgi:hypothetical protein